MNKIQLRKKIHSDFVCVDLRNASFINIKSAHFFYINIISAHVIIIFFKCKTTFYTHTQINSLTITHSII